MAYKPKPGTVNEAGGNPMVKTPTAGPRKYTQKYGSKSPKINCSTGRYATK